MANPSLQIGNDNWAIKEDNLLGYSTAGTRFVPQPITMTRASAGTRVNSSGLVETVELLGIEEVTNGDFTQLPLGTGWDAYTSGSSTVAFTEGAILSIDGSNSNVGVYQQNIFTNGVQYKIIVSVKATASFDAEIVESQGAATQTIIGTVSLTTSYQDFVFYFTGTGTNDLFIHRLYGETAGANQSIYIKEVSVKESTKNNLARVDYDGTASSLLAEPQRTNLVTYSSDFSNSYFQKVRSTISTDQIISPDGTQNADKFIEDSALGTKLLWTQDEVISIGDKITWSVFAKKGEREWIMLRDTQAGSFTVFFDLENGVIGTSSGVDSSKIEDYGSGWYRCSITYTSTTTTARGRLYLADADSGESYQGNGTSGLYIWGAQLEEGSYDTSYIPTSGSTVTRNQDIFTRDGIGSLIGSEGVLFVEMAALSNDGTNRGISLNDGTATNRLLLYFSSASNQIAVISTGFTGSIIYTLPDETLFNKIAVRYKANNITLWVDGASRGTPITSATIPTFTAFKFDSGSAASPFYGKVKQLQVYDTALTDTELATLTTI